MIIRLKAARGRIIGNQLIKIFFSVCRFIVRLFVCVRRGAIRFMLSLGRHAQTLASSAGVAKLSLAARAPKERRRERADGLAMRRRRLDLRGASAAEEGAHRTKRATQ